jgi:NAD(P)-dependent dehydrogenase (short-subunit alcohol dehydrogenase family)
MPNYNPFSLEGKTILVTGASSGIGQSTAIECSKLGAKLIVTARNVERLQSTLSQLDGDGHAQIIAELTNREDLCRLADACPMLDGLVLCAGKGLTLPFKFSTPDKFDEMFAVNYFAPVELLRLLVRSKKIRKAASVVFVASVGGISSFDIGNSIYGATKSAMFSTMKFCALELSGQGIRVNSVNPGMVETPLIHRSNRTDEELAKDKMRYPLKRYGTPIDVAHGVVYLLSNASAWVTGQSLVIDGGITI